MNTSPQSGRWVSLGLIFGGHTPNYIDAQSKESTLPRAPAPIKDEEHEYEELMREAGYEPDVPYPGARSMPWPSTCIECGASRRPTVQDVERGVKCKHSRRGAGT